MERETGKQSTPKMERRSEGALRSTDVVEAEYDEVGRRKYALLREIEALKRDEVQRGLDGLDGQIKGDVIKTSLQGSAPSERSSALLVWFDFLIRQYNPTSTLKRG